MLFIFYLQVCSALNKEGSRYVIALTDTASVQKVSLHAYSIRCNVNPHMPII